MFIRKRGRRYLILHSYRDGRGRVCQRRLGHFLDAAGLQRQLAELPKRCPDLAGSLAPIRQQAEAMLSHQNPDQTSERVQRIRRTARLLSTYLAEESDPEVWRQCSDELAALRAKLPEVEVDEVEQARARLSPRRRRFDPCELEAQPYREALDRKAEQLVQEGRLAESAEVLKERVQHCPTPAARLTYGSVLHQLGRIPEAVEQYERVPFFDSYRHFNCAAASWQLQRPEEALVHLLRGVTRDTETMDALIRAQKKKTPLRGEDYWREFGDIWPEAARRFAAKVCNEMLVRFRLTNMFNRGVLVRELISAHSRAWLVNLGLGKGRPQ